MSLKYTGIKLQITNHKYFFRHPKDMSKHHKTRALINKYTTFSLYIFVLKKVSCTINLSSHAFLLPEENSFLEYFTETEYNNILYKCTEYKGKQ